MHCLVARPPMNRPPGTDLGLEGLRCVPAGVLRPNLLLRLLVKDQDSGEHRGGRTVYALAEAKAEPSSNWLT